MTKDDKMLLELLTDITDRYWTITDGNLNPRERKAVKQSISKLTSALDELE